MLGLGYGFVISPETRVLLNFNIAARRIEGFITTRLDSRLAACSNCYNINHNEYEHVDGNCYQTVKFLRRERLDGVCIFNSWI